MFKDVKMKTCNKCKIEKPKTEFGLNNARSDKLTIWCKPCEKEKREYNLTQPKIAPSVKKCNKCLIEKPISEFRKGNQKKDGYEYTCKDCQKAHHMENPEKRRAYCREYNKNNKEKIILMGKVYYQNNKEKVLESRKKYHQKNIDKIKAKKAIYRDKTKDKIKQKSKDYYAENKEIINDKNRDYYVKNRQAVLDQCKKRAKLTRPILTIKQKHRRKTDPFYAFKTRICNLIRCSIYNKGYNKTSKTCEILGCTYDDFKTHIENQFVDGMSWENRSEWHLDHKHPISLAKDEQEVIKLNHYTNFQPLWAEDNLRKGCKIITPQQTALRSD